jgi:hypothetical protein
MPQHQPARRPAGSPVNRPAGIMTPQKSVREYLQEITNGTLMQTARDGFREIDRISESAKSKLKKLGISNADEFMDDLTIRIKKRAAEMMTGRPAGR